MALPTIENMLPLQRDGNAVSATTAAACTGNAATATLAATATVALGLFSSGTALPSAVAGLRATVYVLLGGAATSDLTYICLKDGATGNYSWVQIATGTLGA